MTLKFLGKTISGPFTIPSGIITTHINVIERFAKEIPAIGVITTKSIGLEKRAGNREPILSQYAPGCFLNAVGLTNPGAEAFASQLQGIGLPKDRFLLTSIFGKDPEEFVKVARILAPMSDGLELNLSCPHAKGYGMAMGQDPELVKEITRAVKSAVKLPVIPKLTPNVPDIGMIAKAAKEGGADAICAINTVGPGFQLIDGHPILSNQYGGMSGKGILPMALKCVHEIRKITDLPIIGCGGIHSAEDIRAFKDSGADIFGIGSALIGLAEQDLKAYFDQLIIDLDASSNRSEKVLNAHVDMTFTKYKLRKIHRQADDFAVLEFAGGIDIKPGQFVFTWIPGQGEKPFSVLDDQPLMLAVQRVGMFTEQLMALEAGDDVYIRGPYGQSIALERNRPVILVGGGTGTAALYIIAKAYPVSHAYLGARDERHHFYLDQFKARTALHIATDDGSIGFKGYVTDLLKSDLEEEGIAQDAAPPVFLNCGPPKMVEMAERIEMAYTDKENIYSSIDYMTKCGVGICGSCASKGGRRSCVDGPFLKEAT